MNYPNTCEIIGCNGYAIVFTSVNLQHSEATVKILPSIEEAIQYVHDFSHRQFPEWHQENCEFCKAK